MFNKTYTFRHFPFPPLYHATKGEKVTSLVGLQVLRSLSPDKRALCGYLQTCQFGPLLDLLTDWCPRWSLPHCINHLQPQQHRQANDKSVKSYERNISQRRTVRVIYLSWEQGAWGDNTELSLESEHRWPDQLVWGSDLHDRCSMCKYMTYHCSNRLLPSCRSHRQIAFLSEWIRHAW